MKNEKKFKLSRENAVNEFNRIVEEFNFSISTDTKERIVTMKINNIDMETTQEMAEADYFILKIMAGKIKYDEDRKKIVVSLSSPVEIGDESPVITEMAFGKFTRATQKAIRVENNKGKRVPVQLNEINFGTMEDKKADAVLMAMTGTSDIRVLNGLEIQDYNDLKMVGGYFFS